ncbi:RNA recognition motif domain [Trypanosoma melophagium]|uniref:RNA recognition motif domain n=1 Tax=Trypanosoma melophagium TaxID=715481 RepID=UPI00351A0A8F|nr:RNA recognition motif domain [Trypanosoma melophagium]
MPSYTIRVRGLPEETSVDSVRDFFSRVGEVTECTVNSTVATLSFENEDDFNEALNMNGMEFENGAILEVSKATEADQQQQQQEPSSEDQQKQEEQQQDPQEREKTKNGGESGEERKEASNVNAGEAGDADARDSRNRFREEFKVAVRHIPENATEQQLRELFEPLGTISDFFLEPRRRYAFVGFDNADSVESALQMSGREINGMAIEVERKRNGPRENALECKVVVKGLPPNTTEEAIRNFFAPAGEAVDVFIHEKKQFAFVGFPDETSCAAALRLSGEELDGTRVEIERRQRQRCFKCNKEGHVALQCRAVDQMCRNCGRPGHLARDCRSGGNHHHHHPQREYRPHHGMHHHNYHQHYGGSNNNNNSLGDRRGHYYGGGGPNNHNNSDRRDYNNTMDRRDDRRNDRRDYYNDRRRARSRSDSYERHHRRRGSRSRSRSPKRFVRERERERDRSRSPPRRRY